MYPNLTTEFLKKVSKIANRKCPNSQSKFPTLYAKKPSQVVLNLHAQMAKKANMFFAYGKTAELWLMSAKRELDIIRFRCNSIIFSRGYLNFINAKFSFCGH